MPGGRVQQRGEDADERRLARPVRTEQAEDGAGLDREVEAVEGDDVAEAVAHPLGWIAGLMRSSSTTIAPTVVRARTSMVSSVCSGRPEASSALWIFPAVELTSSQAATPSRMPTSTSPSLVSSATEPRAASPSRTSPLADFALTSAFAMSMAMLPFAALMRRSRSATPTQVSPLEFLITALPCELAHAHVARPGGHLGVAGHPVDRDVAGAALEVERRDLAEQRSRRGRS